MLIKYNGLSGGLADSNYLYALEPIPCTNFRYVKRLLRAHYVHDRNRARNLLRPGHYSCVIYRGICSFRADYIGETVCNAWLRWNEHENSTDKNSECAKHLNENDNHEFKWSILSLAPRISIKRKILEAYFIKTLNPILNNQLNSGILTLSRNGIT